MGCCHTKNIDDNLVVNLNTFKLYKCKNNNYYTTIDGKNIDIILSNDLINGYDNCFTLTFTNSNIIAIEFKSNNSVKIIYIKYDTYKSDNIHLKYNVILSDHCEWEKYLNEMNEFNLWREKMYQDKYGKIYNIIINNNKIL